MVQNQNEFVNMQSLVAAYDAGLEARDVSLCHKLFPCAQLPKFESEIEMDSRMESRITCTRWFSVGIFKYKPGYKSHDLL